MGEALVDVESWDGATALPMLYAKTATEAINTWLCWVEGPYVCVRWGQQGGAMQDARFKCEPKNEGRANATTAEQQALKEAVAKWKKQQKKKYFLSPDAAATTFNLKPMLAKDYNKERGKVQFPAYAQPKFDGVRCLAYRKDGKVFLQSRGGDPYVVHHIQEQLETCLRDDSIILDGELYHHGTSLQTINSWVRRPQEASINILYVIYDLFDRRDPEATWGDRLLRKIDFLNAWPHFGAQGTHLIRASTASVSSHDQVKYYHDQYVQLGYEGAIIRLASGVYKFGYRSSDLLKYKAFQDGEFEIVGWARGKGKFENVPTFRLKTSEGKEFDATPKGTEQERLDLLQNADSYIGKMATVRYFDFTDDGIPHYPLFIGLREEGQ